MNGIKLSNISLSAQLFVPFICMILLITGIVATNLHKDSKIIASSQEQDSVINEITVKTSEVSRATGDVSNAIKDVQTVSSETNETATVLNDAANDITSLSDNLQSSVDSFLKEIRTQS